MNIVVLYLLLLRATATSFSGFGSVPLVREDLVERLHVLTDQQLNDAIAISQTTPGPLGMYVVVIGYFAAGLTGAAAGALALATPAIVAVPVLWAVRHGRAHALQGACRGIVVVSCVLMFHAVAQLAAPNVTSPAFAVMTVVSFATLALTRVPPIAIIAASALMGLVLA